MMDVHPYNCMTPSELAEAYAAEMKAYESCKQRGLRLNIARGKPSSAQLDLVSDILQVLISPEECYADGVDARNYGDLAGLHCAREYWADVLGCQVEEVFVGGSSSLTLMYD